MRTTFPRSNQQEQGLCHGNSFEHELRANVSQRVMPL